MQDYLPCTTKALKEQENRLYVRIKSSKKFFVFLFRKILLGCTS
jgi:hypothetical protein